MQLRLGVEPPTARTVLAVRKGPAELDAQCAGGVAMRRRWTRLCIQLTAQYLCDEVIWIRAQIGIGRGLLQGLGHDSRLARALECNASANLTSARRYSKNFASSGR